MWLLVTHPNDRVAQRLAASWASVPTAIVTAADLSQPGWQHFPAGGGEDTVAVNGSIVRADTIRAVITRIAAVTEHDLPHIVEADRGFVALEMTAFLRSWLFSLRCPVINRPTATSLMGPGWSAHAWRVMAARAGLRVADGDGFGPNAHLVCAVGDQCLGTWSPEIAQAVLRLVRAASVQLLGLRLSSDGPSAEFLGVEPWFDLARDDIADLLRRHLLDVERSAETPTLSGRGPLATANAALTVEA